jgi:general secretion pathway protein K
MTAIERNGPRSQVTLSSEGGIALVVVLWMLALLTVIANSMVFSLRSDVQVAANNAGSARAEAAADAGVHKAIRELVRPATDPLRWQGNGLTHEWLFDDVAMRVTIIDEAGKIDLNAAPETLLGSLFRSLGVDETLAVSLADAIVDWRDPDDLRRVNGAEKEDYVAAGKDYGPRNANFETIEELRLVLGMNDDLFRRAAPLITVYSGRSGVSSSVAPRAVLMALPGMTPEQVDAYLAERQTLLAQGLPVSEAPFALTSAAQRVGDTFSIQVHAVLGDNIAFFREAVAQVTANPKAPVVILAWRAPGSGHRDFRELPAPVGATQ